MHEMKNTKASLRGGTTKQSHKHEHPRQERLPRFARGDTLAMTEMQDYNVIALACEAPE